MNKILDAARVIASHRLDRAPLPPFGPDLEPRDLATGYAVQYTAHDLLAADHGELAGYKIGCTSDVMQNYLSIPHPCSGALFARRIYPSGVSLAAGDYLRVGVECEIAVRMGRDLRDTAGDDAPYTRADVAAAVDAYFPAIEIVDDRYVKWETLGAPTLVADDFFSAGSVLGEAVLPSRVPDLRELQGRGLINGAEVARGTGADVLGHPLDALLWLANHLAAQGRSLRAGQIVSTGSVIRTVWLKAGDVALMDFTGLGTVELRLA